jgi:hypothetical protein
MKGKRTVSAVIILIVGIALIGFSRYITHEVESGKLQIADAQGKVDKGNSLFSGDPVTKQIGKGLTGGAQKKIDAGQQQINFYEGVASVTLIGGIVCVIVGVSCFFLRKKKK